MIDVVLVVYWCDWSGFGIVVLFWGVRCEVLLLLLDVCCWLVVLCLL